MSCEGLSSLKINCKRCGTPAPGSNAPRNLPRVQWFCESCCRVSKDNNANGSTQDHLPTAYEAAMKRFENHLDATRNLSEYPQAFSYSRHRWGAEPLVQGVKHIFLKNKELTVVLGFVLFLGWITFVSYYNWCCDRENRRLNPPRIIDVQAELAKKKALDSYYAVQRGDWREAQQAAEMAKMHAAESGDSGLFEKVNKYNDDLYSQTGIRTRY